MVKKKTFFSAIDFPGSGRGAGGGRGHSREVWVELCLRGEIVHFATQFKTLFHDPELFRLAYRIEYFFFNTYIKELDFLKEIVGSTHVARSSPTFTLFLRVRVRKNTLFNTLRVKLYTLLKN